MQVNSALVQSMCTLGFVCIACATADSCKLAFIGTVVPVLPLTTAISLLHCQAIRSAQDGSAAKATLCAAPFSLSEEQADGVLSLTLRRLTALEAGKLQDEAQQLRASIGELQQLLGSRELVLAEVGREAQEAAKRHGGPRRSALVVSLPNKAGSGRCHAVMCC